MTEPLELVAVGGLILNGLATLGSYVALRVQLEHRLTKLETLLEARNGPRGHQPPATGRAGAREG